MKAIICTKSGSPEVLQLREVEKPSPKANEVLIKVHAATVTTGDITLRTMPGFMFLPLRLIFGVRKKEIPGHELAGEVEAVGASVTRFQVGDRVFGTTTNLPVGANAEYVCLPEDHTLAHMPTNMSYEEAAAVPVGAITAMRFLKKGDLQSEEQVLIYGASGSVGTYAVQLARYYGAVVTGVCSSSNLDMVRSLGATTVIDYTQEDFTKHRQRYDLIFDAVGKTSKHDYRASLAPDGRFVSVSQTDAKESLENLLAIKDIIEAGQLRAVIDRRYPLEQTAEAHRYVEQGHKKGNLVITVVP